MIRLVERDLRGNVMRGFALERSSGKRIRWIMIGIMAFLLAMCVLMPLQSHADRVYFLGGSGYWSDAYNWYLKDPLAPNGWIPGHVPSDGDDVDISNATVIYDAWNNPSLGDTLIDNAELSQSQGALSSSYLQLGLNGTYNLSGGTLTVNTTSIESHSTSTFNQTNGTHTVGSDLIIGSSLDSSGTGTYNLSGDPTTSILKAVNNEYIGYWGIGTFNQAGGKHIVDGTLFLGFAVDSYASATYNLSDGILKVNGAEYIGCNITGTFNQTNGTHTVGSDLSPSEEYIGFQGSGTYTQTGGSNSVNGNLYLGWALVYDTGGITEVIKGNGTYKLSSETGESTLTVNGYEHIGVNNEGTGTFSQTEGAHTINGYLFLAIEPGSSGTYNLFGGTLTVNEDSDPNTVVYVDNKGTFNVKNATANFNVIFVNRGAYISEPSAATYFTDLSVESDGYFHGPGTEFFITGNLWNISTQSLYSHSQGTLFTFTGAGPHEIWAPSVDRGANMSGYTNNYALRNIKNLGTFISLGNTLYVEGLSGATISGDAITNIEGNGWNIYYISTLLNNTYLNKKTYALVNGGQLIPIDPTCECDLTHDGRCNMQDWLLFGQRWGASNCNTVPCACDLNDDGRCNMSDWLLFGKNWGRTDCPTQ